MAAEIESITGQMATGENGALTWFVVTHSDGAEEYRQGTLLDASHLASTAGLHLDHNQRRRGLPVGQNLRPGVASTRSALTTPGRRLPPGGTLEAA